MITTFLHDSELNEVLPDPNVQKLLDEVRKRTGENWQIVSCPDIIIKKWFRKDHVIKTYGLYLYVGGCGPWQAINFYSAPEAFSINTHVDMGTIANYLMGIMSGYHKIDFDKKRLESKL